MNELWRGHVVNLTGAPQAEGRRGRPVLAAFLSTVVPGAGQWYAGRRRRAFLLLGIAGVGLGATLWLAGRGAWYLLRLFVQPQWLWTLLVVNLVILVVRVYAVADAYALERRLRPGSQPGRGWPARAVVVMLVLAVILPHVVLGYYGLEALDTIQVLTVEDSQAGSPQQPLGPTTTLPPLITASALPLDAFQQSKEVWLPEFDLQVIRPLIVPREVNAYEVPLVPLHERLERDRLTVLLAGGDAGPGRWSLRTDVMIVATMNLETGKAVLFSISRDMVYPPLPASLLGKFEEREYREVVDQAQAEGIEPPSREEFESCKCFPDRINAIWTYTTHETNLFPDAVDRGMEALRQTLGLLLGLPIDYYALVDMAGFVDLVDALGGLDIYATEAMDVGYSPAREGEDPVVVTIPGPGNYHLDGHEALAFVRNRAVAGGDSARMRRQRCTLAALAAEIEPATVALRFSRIARAVRQSTVTNVPLSFLPDLVDYAAALDIDDIATVALSYPYYAPELSFRELPIVDPDRIRWKVQAALSEVETPEGAAELAEQCTVLPAR